MLPFKKPKFIDLIGERVELVTVNISGLNDMHEYSTKEEFYRFIEYPPFKKISETRDYLEQFIKLTNSEISKEHYWFIKFKEENKIVGTIGLRDIDVHRMSCSIHFGLSPDYWGRGLIKESELLLLKYLFNELNFFRVFAMCPAQNNVLFTSLSKQGFQREATFRKYLKYLDGNRYDCHIMTLLKEEFNEQLFC